MKNKKRSYKEIEEDMPLSAAKIEDKTFGSCHRYRLLSPYISLYLLISPIILSCSGGTLFHSYKPLPVEGWERHDTVCFDLPRQERDIKGTLFIGLRTTAQVGFRDIVLAVEQHDEMSDVCHRDTVRYQLTDAEGDALGKGVNIHQYETKQLPIHLLKDRRSTIRIHHLMRHETICGITEVGIKIDKAL